AGPYKAQYATRVANAAHRTIAAGTSDAARWPRLAAQAVARVGRAALSWRLDGTACAPARASPEPGQDMEKPPAGGWREAFNQDASVRAEPVCKDAVAGQTDDEAIMVGD